MEKIRRYIDENFDRFVKELRDLCRIPSVSAQNEGLEDCARHLIEHLKGLGFEARIISMGGPANPPLVYGRLNSPGASRTLLIYGHFDVQPVDPLEDWKTPPFEPTLRDGFLYGRGTNDDKGQFFAHLKAIEALQQAGGGIPLNLRLILDPQEEIGTPMMESFVRNHFDLLKADYGFSADGEAARGNRITLTYGNRGDCYVKIKFKTAHQDAHSGLYGGVMPSAAWRLVKFLNTLVDDKGRVLIDGFYDSVAPPSDIDLRAMEALPYDPGSFKEEMGIAKEAGPDRLSHWEKIMFQPTCNISGVTSGYGGPGEKTVIPCEAHAKIDMRLVKNQTPPEILEKFKRHAVKHGFADIEIEKGTQYFPSRIPLDHPMSPVIRDAVRQGFGTEPLINPVNGGSNPNYIWNEVAGIAMIEVSYAQFGAQAHAPNEHMSLDHFRKGIETSVRMIVGLAS